MKTTVSSGTLVARRRPVPAYSSTSTCRGTPSSATTVIGAERSDPNSVSSPAPRRAMTARRCGDPQRGAGGGDPDRGPGDARGPCWRPSCGVSSDVAPGQAAAHPGDDLVVDGAAGRGPVVGGRLAVRARPEQHDLVARRRRSSPPRSTTNWSMQIRPRIGRRLPSTQTSAVFPAWRGTPSPYPSGTRPTRGLARRGPGVAVGDAGAGVRSYLVSASGARTVIAGSSPRSGLRPGAGSRPYDAMPQRTRSKRLLGRSSAPPELARWRTSGRSPARSAPASASRKARSWASLAGWAGSSLQAKCDQMPVTRQTPSASPARAAATRSGQSVGGRAAAGEAGVDLELDAGRRAGDRGADLVELGRRCRPSRRRRGRSRRPSRRPGR